MWVDQRGSEILDQGECLRLVALAAKNRAIGRLAFFGPKAPIVLPVNFVYEDRCVVVRLGPGCMADMADNELAAFEVDHVDEGVGWSVLVRGLAVPLGPEKVRTMASLPRPLVPEPGTRYISVRADVVTGRRFELASN